MSATRHYLAASPSGNVDQQGRATYQVPYHVEVDDPADGPRVVLEYLRDQGLWIGALYRAGNDEDPFAFCNAISAPRQAQSATRYLVQLTYGPLDRQTGQTPGGSYSTDPTQWMWQHQMGYANWSEAVWKAYNEIEFPHPWAEDVSDNCYTRAAGTYGPVVNSAGVVLDPPLMKDTYDRVWQVTCFSREYNSDTSDLYMGAINNDNIQYSRNLVRYYGFRQTLFNPYQVKCTNASATFRTVDVNDVRIAYWEWTFEFRFRLIGWNEEVLDRGIGARAAATMDDGIGGQMGTLPDAAAPVMPVVDGRGRRVPELVLFDGKGLPLTAGHAREDEGYYFEWRKDDAQPFADLPFDFFKVA